MPSIFTRIINRELPAKIFHETDDIIVFADIAPQDAVHLLIVPKQEYKTLFETPPDVIALLMQGVKDVAKKLGLENHFRIQVANGYRQEVDHLHIHFLSNRGADKLTWL